MEGITSVLDRNKYTKERYRDLTNYLDFETEYYIILNCIDRLKSILIDRYGNLNRASIVLGYTARDLYRRFEYLCILPNLKGLAKLCKRLDISFQYAILGGDEEYYKVSKITFGNLRKLYSSAYVDRKNPLITAAICNAYFGRTKSVPIKYLIRIAREQRVTIDWLLEG